ncbi:hypothetical protein HRI_002422600 [Hibiscus trionum]|uniref:Uncharacterized protein n=1 Tax=Hibiscus trionum TaxID=183268 RepID=A0A9W7I3M6_HIBTR|nr:hypothetical protein HRI_002422600 [Hibiscus trionum]
MAKIGKNQMVSLSDTEVMREQRGREEMVDSKATRQMAKSKDVISSIESCLTRVEESVWGMGAQVDNLQQRVKGLKVEDAEIYTTMKAMMLKLEDTMRAEMGQICIFSCGSSQRCVLLSNTS